MQNNSDIWLWLWIYIAAAFVAGFAISNWITNELWKDAAHRREYRIINTVKYIVKKTNKRNI